MADMHRDMASHVVRLQIFPTARMQATRPWFKALSLEDSPAVAGLCHDMAGHCCVVMQHELVFTMLSLESFSDELCMDNYINDVSCCRSRYKRCVRTTWR